MRNIKKIGSIALILASFIYLSCNDDSDDNLESVLLNSDLYGRWRIKSITGSLASDLNQDEIANENFLLELNDCFLDNLIIFRSEFDYQFIDEFNKCNPEDYNLTEGVFNIGVIDNQTQINFNPDLMQVSIRYNWRNVKLEKMNNEIFLKFRTEPEDFGLLSNGFGEAGFADVILVKQ